MCAAARPGSGTLVQVFFESAERYDKPDAFQVKRGGVWHRISHRELVDRVRHVALGLAAIGIRQGEPVAILSENRPEWAIADYACLTAGIPNVPLYPTLPAERIFPMLVDSGAVAVFVSTADQARKLASLRGRLPALRSIIGFADAPLDAADGTLAQLEARGTALDTPTARAEYRERAEAIGPNDLATIIYTSGTSGEPKGVMLTHDNIYSNVAACRHVLDFPGNDVCLSFLPLSHIFERMGGHFLMYAVGASICYAESLGTLLENFGEVRPTFVMAVPRIYERMYSTIWQRATAGGVISRTIFRRAQRVAEQWQAARLERRTPGAWLTAQHALIDRLLFRTLRARMGGRIRYFVSGGAPLSAEIHSFFYAAGLVILEGYGLTETSPVISVNLPGRMRIGSVGPVIEGVDVRIADDGEILCRGPNIMRAYHNQPEATDDAIDRHGWFHTGDIGELRDGILSITDRKKDLIVTAGGKNIAPQPIENRVRGSQYVSQTIMIGDRRPHAVLLVVPNFDALEMWASAHHIAWGSRAELVAHPEVKAHVVRDVYAQLVGLPAFERPKRVALLDHELTIDAGELTPKLSIMRRAIAQKYASIIAALYAD